MIKFNFYGDSKKVNKIYKSLSSGIKDTNISNNGIVTPKLENSSQCSLIIKENDSDINLDTVFTFHIDNSSIDYLKNITSSID